MDKSIELICYISNYLAFSSILPSTGKTIAPGSTNVLMLLGKESPFFSFRYLIYQIPPENSNEEKESNLQRLGYHLFNAGVSNQGCSEIPFAEISPKM